jgi:hypothetical protein
MATAHGDQYFTRGEQRAAEAIGARDVHGKGKRVQTVSLRSPGPVRRRRRGEEVSVSTEHSGDDVAADGRLGMPCRARRRAVGERSRLGEGRRRRVEGG